MTMRVPRVLMVVAACLLHAVGARSEIRLPKMLSTHAVLQRGQPIHVWGWSDPGECVRINFHAQQRQVCASEIGVWSSYLDPEVAGGPYQMMVARAGTTTPAVTLTDLLVGDVWFASGQSNMEMPLEGWGPGTPVRDSAREIAAAGHPSIRLLRFEQAASPYPLRDITATWSECTPATAAKFSAVAYFFGKEIEATEHVPIGLIDATWGGTPIESWISLRAMAEDAALMPVFASRATFTEEYAESDLQIAAEKREDATAAKAGRPAPHHPWHPKEASWNPSYLFNGMVAPATGYPVRGFLWYQGESNSDPKRVALYRREMAAMIDDWRKRWGEGDLPFLYVQISSFNSPPESWGELRNAQREALAVARTAMAVSLDVGQPDNVHPPDKQTVGHRLALGARALSYGEALEWSGPLVRSARSEAGAVRVFFDHATGLTTSGAVRGFELADADGRFVPADGRIEGETVLVRAEGMPDPSVIRYAWANVTDATLANAAGLPASTFRIVLPRR